MHPVISKILLSLCALSAAILTGCSPSRHVPEGRYLLDDVKITVTDSTETLSSQRLMPYVRQRPNNKFLHISRLCRNPHDN